MRRGRPAACARTIDTVRGRLHTREDSGIRLDADGRWWHDDEPVVHPKIVRAWNRGIERAPDGRYLLRFGRDFAHVTVDDAPLTVVGLREEGGAIVLALSDERDEPLDPGTLRLSNRGVLYCTARGGTMPARLSRDAHFALGDRLVERDGGYELVVGGRRFTVRSVGTPDAR